ncbi:MAG: glutamine--fructose-6-phosphate transaminase (isomerizing) [Thermodesulfovibrionales bacterium]
MCGIVGYIGNREAIPILIESLERLEYRGYDSAGLAFQNGKGIEIYKTTGRIRDLRAIVPDVSNVKTGLGHTRWATHGSPSERNAHPHVAGGIVVVHNGIIENYRELKAQLMSEGYSFSSETDTEVIPQLILKKCREGLPISSAIEEAISLLKGSFALGIMSENMPGLLFALRKGSPLVVGISDDEFFFASDIPALLPYTRRFVFLNDGEICILSREGIRLKPVGSEETIPLDGMIKEVDWAPEMAEKEGYDHFMLKEIYEQPDAVMNTLREWIKEPGELLDELCISDKIKDLRRLHIVACGTSYHAGLIGRYIIEKFVRIPVNVDIASEYRYMDPIVTKGTLFITITQSGETADTLAAQREAKERGAFTLTICNVVGSTATREADAVLYTRAGPEIGVASTKAFTAQIAALCLLAIAIGVRKGKLTDIEKETLTSLLMNVPSLIGKVLRADSKLKEVAETILSAKNLLYLGRGINYPVALEGALKMKEISYIPSEGYPAGEMKHGPIALIEKGLPVIFLAPFDSLHEKIASNIEEVKARGGRVIVITDSPAAYKEKADMLVKVPPTHPAFTPFINVVPLQLLAYHVAVLRGNDVDKPRNLAKSVTVE